MAEQLKPRREPAASGRRSDTRGAGRWLPFLIFFGVLLFIVQREVPVVRMYVDRIVNPEAYAAVTACHEAVLALAERPQTARVVEPGKASETQSGFYVEGIVLGEMGENGREVHKPHGCYTGESGNVISAEPIVTTESK